MAKTDKKLKTLSKEVGKAFGGPRVVKISKMPPKVMKRFSKHISTITDHRAQWDIEYSLESIVIMVFIAVLGGSDTWVDIELFCSMRREWLGKFIELPNGITPCNDTFSRVFHSIDTDDFQKMAVGFITDNLSDIKRGMGIADPKKKHIAIDGKQERGTGRYTGTQKEVKDQQTLHFFDTFNGVCILSRKINKKTNEIPVAQQLLEGMDTLEGTVISGDAMHTQTKHTEIIINKGGDYVFGLKGNQSSLKNDAGLLFTDDYRAGLEKDENTYFQTCEKEHNHIETRKYYLSTEVGELPSVQEGSWKELRSILCVEKTIEDLVSGEVSTETRYYISSLTDIEIVASVVRAHWGVEILHFYQDVVFHQDANQTTDNNAFQNLATIIKMCVTLTKIFAVICDQSVTLTRKALAWDPEGMIPQLLSFYDEDNIPIVLNAPFKEKAPRSRVKVKKYREQKQENRG